MVREKYWIPCVCARVCLCLCVWSCQLFKAVPLDWFVMLLTGCFSFHPGQSLFLPATNTHKHSGFVCLRRLKLLSWFQNSHLSKSQSLYVLESYVELSFFFLHASLFAVCVRVNVGLPLFFSYPRPSWRLCVLYTVYVG